MLAQVGQHLLVVCDLLFNPTLLAMAIFLHAIDLHDASHIIIRGVHQEAHHRTAVVDFAIRGDNYARFLNPMSINLPRRKSRGKQHENNQ